MQRMQVIRIDEPDFGCEGRQEGTVLMDFVTIRDDEQKERIVKVSDAWLYEQNINEGDPVWWDPETDRLERYI